MGFYERDYYRDDGNRFYDAFSLRGEATKWLIIINVAVFIIQLITLGAPNVLGQRDPGAFTRLFELDTTKVMQGQVWRLLTCAFLHNPDTWTHIFFNMWLLWLFGGDVESVYGRREFLAFYLTAAVAASAAFLVEQWYIGREASALGASGAVTAVLILCAFHFPNRTILLFFFIPIPIWVLAVFQVVQDTFGMMSGRGGIAFSAHLGGAAFAFLYYKRQWRVLSWLPSLRSFRLPRARPRLRVYREEDKPRQPVSVSAPAPARLEVDEQLEAKLDAVLEKVARQGQASLTEGERAILQRASEIYKKRRT